MTLVSTECCVPLGKYKCHFYFLIKMIRLTSIDKIGPEVADAFNELMKLCKANMVDAGDLLVTFQNGFIFAKHPTIGYGENLEDIQQLNLVTSHGIGPHTDDDKYFEKYKYNFLNGDTELETTTTGEMHRYLRVWENLYFLRILTQLSHLLNHEHYDWALDIRKSTGDGRRKSKYIEGLLPRFSQSPKFYAIINESYNRYLRNADAHGDIYFVNEGFILRNIKAEKGLLQGMSYEQWERIFIITYLLAESLIEEQRLIFKSYIQTMRLLGMSAIPILIPYSDGSWGRDFIMPDANGKVWRFRN